MPRTLLLLIAGLDHSLLQKTESKNTPLLSSFPHRSTYTPSLPAVTSSIQATLTTGVTPAHHGIIANGLLTHNRPTLTPHLDLTSHANFRQEVSFWEQANSLLQAPRFWKNSNKKVAMLFWQNSMPSSVDPLPAADIVLTPKPIHTTDSSGVKTLTACWSNPADLYPTLAATLGPFPLHNYWSPMAGLPSSTWITAAAQHVWNHHAPDLQLVYIPHLDYNLQRLGPSHPQNIADLQALDALLTPLVNSARNAGHHVILLGDYGITDTNTPILPNLALRQANLLTTTLDPAGKTIVDHATTQAFAMADHQIAHIYCQPHALDATRTTLQNLPGIAQLLGGKQIEAAGLNNPRSGNLIALAQENAWFAHDWWPLTPEGEAEKPQWQFTVDIHAKPGFDPRELFFDPAKKCITQNPALVKGSHALTSNPATHPILLSTTPLPQHPNLHATHLAPWLKSLLD